tara:strand:- start:186 stop:983 length:798 start_codon:yes stop_codon:yes gene_type:complete
MNFVGREEYIKSVQKALKLTPDGVDGKLTWQAISDRLIPVPVDNKQNIVESLPTAPVNIIGISDAAYNLILKYEVGGGSSYYTKCLQSPTYPGGASGVTIGIGYDLGYNTIDQFQSDWKHVILPDVYNRLAVHIGKKSEKAKAAIPSVKDIKIPWASAEIVFKNNTLPRFIRETIKAFPGAEKLHPDAFGALVSLVFNRGGSVSGDSRVEMLSIRNAIKGEMYVDDIYSFIAQQIITMKRLWVGKGLDGLLVRRNEESALVKSCV